MEFMNEVSSAICACEPDVLVIWISTQVVPLFISAMAARSQHDGKDGEFLNLVSKITIYGWVGLSCVFRERCIEIAADHIFISI